MRLQHRMYVALRIAAILVPKLTRPLNHRPIRQPKDKLVLAVMPRLLPSGVGAPWVHFRYFGVIPRANPSICRSAHPMQRVRAGLCQTCVSSIPLMIKSSMLTDVWQIKKRSREPRRSRGGKKGGKATRNESGQVSSGSGSDDDSYDSQERRSEAGDHGEGD